jgi:hypothetical protein
MSENALGNLTKNYSELFGRIEILVLLMNYIGKNIEVAWHSLLKPYII